MNISILLIVVLLCHVMAFTVAEVSSVSARQLKGNKDKEFKHVHSTMKVQRIGGGGVPGGWTNLDVNDERVQNVARFAVDHQNPSEPTTFVVQSAKSQVVAGMNYDIVVAVTKVNTNTCNVVEYRVWDRFGQLQQMDTTIKSDHCD